MSVQQVNSSDASASLEAAHRALRADSSVQFQLVPTTPPPAQPAWAKALLHWLADFFRPVGRFIQRLLSFLPDAPFARIILVGLLVLLALAFARLAWVRYKSGEWRFRRSVYAPEAEYVEEEQWAPDAAPARAWLEEADALAAKGQYAEAVHHLLLRSVEDIGRRRPDVVRPALTSRELAAAQAIPAGARRLFSDIAALVERSLFGGRAVGSTDWSTARAAYADFALPQAWRR